LGHFLMLPPISLLPILFSFVPVGFSHISSVAHLLERIALRWLHWHSLFASMLGISSSFPGFFLCILGYSAWRKVNVLAAWPKSFGVQILVSGELYTDFIIAWATRAGRETCASNGVWENFAMLPTVGHKRTCWRLHWWSLLDWAPASGILFPLHGWPGWVESL
jgi:hypothetical protein